MWCIMSNTATTVLINGLAIVAAGALVYYIISTATESIKEASSNRTSILDPYGMDIQFILFTRNNNETPEYLKKYDDESIEQSHFDVSRPTKFIIHGYLSSVNEDVFYVIYNAYLEEEDFNVIGVDWSRLVQRDYVSAIKAAYLVAQELGDFIWWLVKDKSVRFEDIHVIGHSLGAHVAGLTADQFSENGKLGRITGLDPAGPGFNEAAEFARLDPGDADLVDIVHTCMQTLSLAHPVGHVDFYPNGGRAQPGCPSPIENLPDNMLCNHGRAYYLFAESIKNKRAFKSFKCDSVDDAVLSRCFEETDVYMGQPESYKYGLYYFKTRGKSPYSLT